MHITMDYSCTIKARPFLFIETMKAARLLKAGDTSEEIKVKSINDNLFQLKTEARRKEIAVTVLKRLAILDDYLFDQIVNGVTETAKQLVIYTIMKTDRLFFEFMHEVYRDKLIVKAPDITTGDFSLFFRNKAEQSSKVSAWGDYTYYKLQQVYTRILFEAGFIKKSKDKLNIVLPIIEKDIAEHLRQIGDGQYIDIMQGV